MFSLIHLLILPILSFGTPSWLEVKEVFVLPDQQTFKSWKQNLYSADEFWIIKDKERFYKYLQQKGATPSLIKKLDEYYRTSIPNDILGAAYSLYQKPRVAGFFYPVNTIKEQIPKFLLPEIYSYMSETVYSPMFMGYQNISDLISNIKSWNMPKHLLKMAIQSIYQKHEIYHLPITPSIWPWIPAKSRHYFVLAFIRRLQDKNALSIDIKIDKNTNINNIARLLSGDREHGPIQTYIQSLFKLNNQKLTYIPLEELLHPFIQKTINSFHLKGGPNCFNCGINVHKEHDFNQTTTYDHELQKILKDDYIQLDKQKPLQTGDLLLYKNKEGAFVHVATYIVENIVFTKNGVNKFSPYIFQSMGDNEKLYFPDNNFQLEIYRIIKNPMGHKNQLCLRVFY